MSDFKLSKKDLKDLSFTTRDDALEIIIRLQDERDVLLKALQKIVEESELCAIPSISRIARESIAKATGETK